MLADRCIFRFLFESPKREAREIVSWKIILVHQFYVNKYELGLGFAYTFLLRNHAWETFWTVLLTRASMVLNIEWEQLWNTAFCLRSVW